MKTLTTNRGSTPAGARIARDLRSPGPFLTSVSLLLTLSALTACSLTPSYDVPAQPLPEQWENARPAADAKSPVREWWRAYGDPGLDGLMTRAMTSNHDLAAAVARIEQARASLKVARAELRPFARASATDSHDRIRNGEALTSEDSRVGLSIDYTVDLWGANRNASEAAVLRLAVSEHNRDAIRLALQTDVALAYFQLLALQERIDIADRNLRAAGELMRLIQVRFDNGAATALDVAQQRTTLLNIEAQIPALRQAVNETRQALATLLGAAPQALSIRETSIASLALPAFDPGLPAELLLRRPDIRAAEAALLAANVDIGVARAAFFPDLGLSVSAAASEIAGSGSTLASIAATLSQTLFAGGAVEGRVELSRAVREELAENYAQTVLIGLAEVESSLSAVTTSERRSNLLKQTVEQAGEAYRLSRVRFDAGAIDLLTVLDSQRTLLNAEDALVQARQSRLAASAELVRALGGG